MAPGLGTSVDGFSELDVVPPAAQVDGTTLVVALDIPFLVLLLLGLALFSESGRARRR